MFSFRGGISFLKTVNTLLSKSTEGRTRHKGGRAFARTSRVRIRVRVRSSYFIMRLGLELGLGPPI